MTLNQTDGQREFILCAGKQSRMGIEFEEKVNKPINNESQSIIAIDFGTCSSFTPRHYCSNKHMKMHQSSFFVKDKGLSH